VGICGAICQLKTGVEVGNCNFCSKLKFLDRLELTTNFGLPDNLSQELRELVLVWR
jgi:hypothetical protein